MFTTKSVLIYSIAVILVLLTPLIFLIFWCPILFYRNSVFYLSRCVKPSFQSIVDPLSSILANVGLYKEPMLSIAPVLVVNGRLELDTLQESFQNRILNLHHPGSEDFVYVKLRQKVRQWLGYFFWETDENFCIENHFEVLKSETLVGDAELRMIIEKLLKQPFPPERSPWRVVLVNNVKLCVSSSQIGPQSIVILNINHAVCDGGSLVNLFRTWCSNNDASLEQPISKFQRSTKKNNKSMRKYTFSYLSTLARSAKVMLQVPIQIASQFIEVRDRNAWTCVPISKWSGQYNEQTSSLISVQLIKAIRMKHETSFMAVLLAGYAGGIKRFMLRKSISVPSSIYCLIPAAIPTTEKEEIRFGNFFSSAMVRLPLELDSVSRLNYIQNSLKKLNDQSVFTVFELIQNIIGRIPTWLTTSKAVPMGNTVLFTSVPGPTKKHVLCGSEVADFMFYSSILPGLSLAGGAVSYADNIRFVFGADSSVIPLNQPLKDLESYIIEEFMELFNPNIPQIIIN